MKHTPYGAWAMALLLAFTGGAAVAGSNGPTDAERDSPGSLDSDMSTQPDAEGVRPGQGDGTPGMTQDTQQRQQQSPGKRVEQQQPYRKKGDHEADSDSRGQDN